MKPTKLLSLLSLLTTVLFLTSGCADEAASPGDDEPAGVDRSGYALSIAGSCDDALAALRARLISEMNERLDESYEDVTREIEFGCWESQVVECASYDASSGGWADTYSPPPTEEEPEDDPEEEPEEEEASEYSTTNTQVVDVDEADFVKNDGGFIYILADGRLQILDAWPAPDAHALSSTYVEGIPRRMFIHEDRAVIYSSLDPIQAMSADPSEWGMLGMFEPCTYGYDCEFTGDGLALQVTILDISDRSAPTVERELVFTGSYLSARRIEDAIYTVVYFSDPQALAPGLSYTPDAFSGWGWCDEGWTDEEVAAEFQALREDNLAIIEELDLSQFLPSVVDTRYTPQGEVVDATLLADCEGFYIDPSADGAALLSVVGFDLVAATPLKATTVVSRPGAVYASRESLYIAVRHYAYETMGWYFEEEAEIEEATTLHKFLLHHQKASVGYMGSGVAKGRVLNQFSMDEFAGDLRVATTTGRLPMSQVHNTLSVLAEETDGGLSVIGQLDHIAPTEDIRSVRFNGETGFVVTFKKTDPLFVIDLSDPTTPTILGELKIPGFSTYMQMIDDDHILAMGYDADDQGSFAWFEGLQLQIFDVSDLTNPKVMHKTTIGTRGSTSDAATDHLAFTYFAARDLLAVPMTICEGGSGGGSYSDLMTFSGLLVFSVTLADGFELLGGVPHQEPETIGDNWGACGNWWTQSNSLVKRSIFMEDWVFSIAMDQIKVASVDDLEHPAVTLPLTGE